LFICSYEIIDIAVVAVMEIIISFRLNSFVLVIENSVPTMSKKYWIGNNRKAPATPKPQDRAEQIGTGTRAE